MQSTRAAVILAAGIGSRLRPLTDDKPKALVEVSGRTILGRAVDALLAYGIERLVVATGYREEAIRTALAGTGIEVAYRKNPRYETTQNSVSLALCRDVLSGSAFFKLDGDVLFDPGLLERVDAGTGMLAAAVDRGARLDPEAMKVRIAAGDRIIAFGKGIPVADAAGESIGIERVSAAASASVFDALEEAMKKGETGLYYEDVYSRLIDNGLVASLVDVSPQRWCEVDSSEDLDRAGRLFP
jgi:choline kinase